MPWNPAAKGAEGELVQVLRDGKAADQPTASTLMKTNPSPIVLSGKWNAAAGKIGWILLWAVGIPIPVLLVLFVLRGCT
jgi:hypothetical protein